MAIRLERQGHRVILVLECASEDDAETIQHRIVSAALDRVPLIINLNTKTISEFHAPAD